MLTDKDKQEIQGLLDGMINPVQLVLFTQRVAGTCQYCEETEKLLKTLAELSDQLSLNVKNFVTDKQEVEDYRIDKIPAVVIQEEKDVGIRFFGIPAGYEFASFLQLILMLSKKESGLSELLKKQIQKIQKPVHIQVFATPTCPYCTSAALTAYQLAIENKNIKADIVEISEFPHLAQKYSVMGVPKVVINEDHSFEGALPEQLFIEHVQNAIS